MISSILTFLLKVLLFQIIRYTLRSTESLTASNGSSQKIVALIPCDSSSFFLISAFFRSFSYRTFSSVCNLLFGYVFAASTIISCKRSTILSCELLWNHSCHIACQYLIWMSSVKSQYSEHSPVIYFFQQFFHDIHCLFRRTPRIIPVKNILL